MKLFAIAFGIVSGVAAIFFGSTFALLSLFDPSQAATIASSSAAIPMLALPKVAELLEQQESRKRLASGKRGPVYDFGGFQLAWPLLLVYGTIVLFSVGQAAGFIFGLLVAAVAPPDPENIWKSAPLWTVPATLMMVLGSYFVGRWIGSRIARRGILTVLMVALLTAVVAIEIDVILMSDASYQEAFRADRLALFHNLRRVIGIFVITMPGLLVGYWRGRKQRLSKYLHYLLGALPPETRDIVVELAFEEAKKVTARPAAHPRLNVEIASGELQPAN